MCRDLVIANFRCLFDLDVAGKVALKGGERFVEIPLAMFQKDGEWDNDLPF